MGAPTTLDPPQQGDGVSRGDEALYVAAVSSETQGAAAVRWRSPVEAMKSMAWDPCVSCGREYHGSTQFTYVTWYVGQERFAYRMRQCDECAAQLRTDARGNGDAREANGQWSVSPVQPDRRSPTAPPEHGGVHHLASRRKRSANGASA